ncbi:hypothetical protein ACOSQ3_029151 [Xanthoceras sorbifolium]
MGIFVVIDWTSTSLLDTCTSCGIISQYDLFLVPLYQSRCSRGGHGSGTGGSGFPWRRNKNRERERPEPAVAHRFPVPTPVPHGYGSSFEIPGGSRTGKYMEPKPVLVPR